MKHAVLVLAYKNIHHLSEYIQFLDEDFLFYIHIDKKSLISKEEQAALFNHKNVVFISRKYKVNWGGVNFLKAMLHLGKEALKNKEVGYIHSVSGQHFPIKTAFEIKNFFHENAGKEFMEFFRLPTERWAHGGLNRVEYYNLYDTFNSKTTTGFKAIKLALILQRLLRIKRKPLKDFPVLYGGSAWWSFSAACLAYTVDYAESHPASMKRLEYTLCAEEMFFQTVIMNSPFKASVVNDNLTLVCWEFRNGNSPATLDNSDFQNLMKSEKLFARRFDYPVSKELMTLLKEELNKKINA
ncbi:beta-1,6-N-acetylglucosaminyltransferase [Negadavirga shengliensis]|uniref:Peptide O-xylosyltransferase n=1 Tax=Negadavirga shengliensis TaxID=1389218 RepID=A0ABV9T309_9BACT